MIVVGQKRPAGPRLEIADPRQRLLHVVNRRAQTARDLRDAPFSQGLHEFADDAVFQSVLTPLAFQLQQQAFAQIARADARRMEALNHLQYFEDALRPDVGCKGQLIHAGLKIAVIVYVPNNHLANLALFVRQFRHANLLEQVFLEGCPRHQRIEHELPFLLLFLTLPHRDIRLRKVIAPFLVELRQALELRLKIVHRRVAVLFCGRIKGHVRRRFRRVGHGSRFLVFATFLLLKRHLGRRRFLQHGILLQLLLHHRLQFQRGRLQQRQRLLQLRSEHLRQGHLLGQM